jgi:hypothetical protein
MKTSHSPIRNDDGTVVGLREPVREDTQTRSEERGVERYPAHLWLSIWRIPKADNFRRLGQLVAVTAGAFSQVSRSTLHDLWKCLSKR